MENSVKDYLTLFDFNEQESTQNFPDFIFDSGYSCPSTPRDDHQGDLPIHAAELGNAGDLQDRCKLCLQKKAKKRKTNPTRMIQTSQMEQDYRRIMNNFVRILPKPSVKNEVIHLKTHINNVWSCIFCKQIFTDFNLFKLHHDSNRQPFCLADQKLILQPFSFEKQTLCDDR